MLVSLGRRARARPGAARAGARRAAAGADGRARTRARRALRLAGGRRRGGRVLRARARSIAAPAAQRRPALAVRYGLAPGRPPAEDPRRAPAAACRSSPPSPPRAPIAEPSGRSGGWRCSRARSPPGRSAALALQRVGVTRVAGSLLASKPGLVAAALARHVHGDVRPRDRLARDPRRRAHVARGQPPGRDAGHLHRRADVRHAARPHRRALARPDRRAAHRPRARDAAGRARHDGLPDAPEPARARAAGGGDAGERRLRRARAQRPPDPVRRPRRPRGRCCSPRSCPGWPPARAATRGRMRRCARAVRRWLARLRRRPARVRAPPRRRPAPRSCSWPRGRSSCWPAGCCCTPSACRACASVGAAAAVLFVVNVTAVLPATPANVGVFQAACVAVLAGAYHVSTPEAIAFAIVLQLIELLTALIMGLPALVNEGLSWREVRLRTIPRHPDSARRRCRVAGHAAPRRRLAAGGERWRIRPCVYLLRCADGIALHGLDHLARASPGAPPGRQGQPLHGQPPAGRAGGRPADARPPRGPPRGGPHQAAGPGLQARPDRRARRHSS